MNTVREKAIRLADALRLHMPAAIVSISHSRSPWGRSSYVSVEYVRGHLMVFGKARISDHGIGMRRFFETPGTKYFSHLQPPSAWSTWISELCIAYENARGQNADRPELFATTESTLDTRKDWP